MTEAMTDQPTPKNKVIHSPLLRFRKRAHCESCPLRDACKIDKYLEISCILALVADSLHINSRLNALRGAHL